MNMLLRRICKLVLCSILLVMPIYGIDKNVENLFEQTFPSSKQANYVELISIYNSLPSDSLLDKFVWGRVAILSLFSGETNEQTETIKKNIESLYREAVRMSIKKTDSETWLKAAEFAYDLLAAISMKTVKLNMFDVLLFTRDACKNILYKKEGFINEANIILAMWTTYSITQSTPNWTAYALNNLSDDKILDVATSLKYQALVHRAVVLMKSGQNNLAIASMELAKSIYPNNFLGTLIEVAWSNGRDGL